MAKKHWGETTKSGASYDGSAMCQRKTRSDHLHQYGNEKGEYVVRFLRAGLGGQTTVHGRKSAGGKDEPIGKGVWGWQKSMQGIS